MKFFYLALVAFLLSGCMGKAPITNRDQILLMSPSEEIALGTQGYAAFLKTAKLSTDRVQVARVRSIGQKIAIAANKPNYKWEFNVVDDKQINAFCMPGGKVVVYTGILDLVKNDDQLATIMSHEVAHALARHGAERMSHQKISSGVQLLGNLILGQTAPQYTNTFNTAYGYGTKYGVMLPYSRSHEYEADEIGVHLMYKAGYNIQEAVNFWKIMKAMKGNAPTEFLSTHPNDDNRILKIAQTIKKIEKK
nr:M48 family metallopeptidase [Sulfurimonas sp. SAG-AH-194-I05]